MTVHWGRLRGRSPIFYEHYPPDSYQILNNQEKSHLPSFQWVNYISAILDLGLGKLFYYVTELRRLNCFQNAIHVQSSWIDVYIIFTVPYAKN